MLSIKYQFLFNLHLFVDQKSNQQPDKWSFCISELVMSYIEHDMSKHQEESWEYNMQ